MTNETQQLAQRLYDEGRLNMEKKMFTPEWSSSPIHISAIPFLQWQEPQIFRELPNGKEAALEISAALAALDNSIPVWRDVEVEWPPTDKTILAYRKEGNAYWLLTYNGVKSSWRIAGTNTAPVFTHWTYPPAAPERKG